MFVVNEMVQKQSPEGVLKKGVLRNLAKFTGKHLCQSLIEKETLAQVFSCGFFKISKNIFSYRTPPVAASDGIMHLVPLIKIRKDQEINIESMSTELIRKPYNKTCFFLKTHTNYGLNSSYGLSKP